MAGNYSIGAFRKFFFSRNVESGCGNAEPWDVIDAYRYGTVLGATFATLFPVRTWHFSVGGHVADNFS
jgi:hypothetical protein